jgi:glycosyltransferase involved in cell wall biosynthesis
MRVVHVGYLRPNSADGVAQTIFGLAAHLPACGVECEVWEFTRDVSLVETSLEYDIPIVRIPARIRRFDHTLHVSGDVQRWIDSAKQAVDLFHLHSVFRADNLWISKLGSPFVLTPNGGYSPKVFRGRRRILKQVWTWLWERHLWSAAAFLHAVSETEAADLRKLKHVPQVVVIPNGVSPSDSEQPGIDPPNPCWLFLGRMAIKQKGLDLLLPAYACARARSPLPKLLLVGPDFRGGKQILQKTAARLNISDAVEISEPIFGAEKRRLFATTKVLLQPSRWEGLPFSALEALAAGVPVLVTPPTGLAECVVAARAGWTCDARVAALAATLTAIAGTSVEEYVVKSTNAKRLVREHFAWSSVARAMADLYARAVSSRLSSEEAHPA